MSGVVTFIYQYITSFICNLDIEGLFEGVNLLETYLDSIIGELIWRWGGAFTRSYYYFANRISTLSTLYIKIMNGNQFDDDEESGMFRNRFTKLCQRGIAFFRQLIQDLVLTTETCIFEIRVILSQAPSSGAFVL